MVYIGLDLHRKLRESLGPSFPPKLLGLEMGRSFRNANYIDLRGATISLG